jgi:predicted RNase H-like HicB family nuclease
MRQKQMTKKKSNTDPGTETAIAALAARPYPMRIEHDEEDGWIGRIPQMPGLIAVGDTFEEMMAIAEDAKRAWIATAINLGRPIPAPVPEETLPQKSGKFMVRVAPAVHMALVAEADRAGVSLNELLANVLSLVVGTGFDGIIEAVARQKRGGRHEGIPKLRKLQQG